MTLATAPARPPHIHTATMSRPPSPTHARVRTVFLDVLTLLLLFIFPFALTLLVAPPFPHHCDGCALFPPLFFSSSPAPRRLRVFFFLSYPPFGLQLSFPLPAYVPTCPYGLFPVPSTPYPLTCPGTRPPPTPQRSPHSFAPHRHVAAHTVLGAPASSLELSSRQSRAPATPPKARV